MCASFFKLEAQKAGREQMLKSMTPSELELFYAAEAKAKVRKYSFFIVKFHGFNIFFTINFSP